MTRGSHWRLTLSETPRKSTIFKLCPVVTLDAEECYQKRHDGGSMPVQGIIIIKRPRKRRQERLAMGKIIGACLVAVLAMTGCATPGCRQPQGDEGAPDVAG